MKAAVSENEVSQASTSSCRRLLTRHVPITQWITSYKKMDLVADIVAGLTLALTMLPQSIAYASLAGLPPQYGLYSTFMGGFIYVLFGTVKEVSIGPTGLQSILTFEFTRGLPIEFVILLTFSAGCVEFLMGILRLGFLVELISVPVICGFQSATSVIIIGSQIKGLLGLRKLKSGKLLDNVVGVATNIGNSRIGDLLLSLSCCLCLWTLRNLKDFSFAKKASSSLQRLIWFISISRNAFVVVASSATAYLFDSSGSVPFILSGNITSGLPPFQIPAWSATVGNTTYSLPQMLYEIKMGIIILPLVAVLANVTIAKAFSTGSPVDATQEMVTLGICNVAGSFVSAMPSCGAFTRSAVSNSSGVRSPLAGLFSGSLVLLVLSFLSPLFYYIPMASLSSILICAVWYMIDYDTTIELWNTSKKDFLCCILTFFSCVFIGIEVGLLVGVAISLAQLIYLWARPDISISLQTSTVKSYYLVEPRIGFFFPALYFFRSRLQKHCKQKIAVVVDCQHFQGIDFTTMQGVIEIIKEFEACKRKLIFINIRPHIYDLLLSAKITEKNRECFYGTVDVGDVFFNLGTSDSPSPLLLSEEEQSKSDNDA